ncbi:hypothetical protein [Azoarcus olearius]|uniref:Uncharacterized protein n=1 Tax=Azoarcus sp. (strain BH72) TaxID=418699 RepID=A1KCM6_AZOSB|nr:hypothetical protein [Azoarcus olearius]ANQ87125.1 hypothetical protein dqs_4109 [Azoarcus olearius]CAL96582.1 hypothetical protein predicted by Glimmer/Critica [Azoarcus olearius]
MAVVFAKTARGQEEIARRAAGLTPRQRRVLICIDGRRSVDELRELSPADDLQHTLGLLEEAGLIEAALLAEAEGATTAITAPLPSITAFAPLPAEADPVRVQQARNFMTNTINAFVGALGASSLLQRIEGAADQPALRALFDEWYHALVSSREGRREAEALRTKLLQVI